MFINYSITNSNISVWYIDDINHAEQAKSLLNALDLTTFTADGYDVATAEDIENILNDNPFDSIYYTIENDFGSNRKLKFDAILSTDDNNDEPMFYLVRRSELDGYIFGLCDDYEEFKVSQSTEIYDELMDYWYNQR